MKPGTTILPGALLGVLGGGQLGRYFALSARTMGYRVCVLDPDPACPAGQVADEHLCAEYDDPEALAWLGRHCAAVTTEFENAPATALETLAGTGICAVRPPAAAVATAQDRIREKAFFKVTGLPVGPYVVLASPADLAHAPDTLAYPAILKTARFGYDGKGQHTVADAAAVRQLITQKPDLLPAVLETRLALRCELSVVLGRSAGGATRCFPVIENRHRNGILDVSIVPAGVDPDLMQQVQAMACALADALDYVGVLAVEFFLLGDGRLLVNEMAPRPHNSGHLTLDNGSCSQFDQQVRLVCGFAPADPDPAGAAVMVNLLGDIWQAQGPDWGLVLAEPQARLHLYGKHAARPGRKMGHLTVVGSDRSQVLDCALRLRADLGIG